MFFQDCFLNYGIYRNLFPIFKAVSQQISEIGIILRGAVEMQIYALLSDNFLEFFKAYMLCTQFLMPSFLDKLHKIFEKLENHFLWKTIG